MRFASWIVVPIGLMVGLVAAGASSGDGLAREPEYFNAHLVVETGWLEENLEHPTLRIVDFGRGSADYEEGHIPGAVFVAAASITAEVDGVPNLLAPVQRVVAALEEAGVDEAGTVVVYDEGSGLWASRLIWAMEHVGHRDARLLNGGWGTWVKEGREISVGVPAVFPGAVTPEVRLEVLATKGWVLKNLDRPDVTLLDVRSVDEFTGDDIRADRGGHIPGAVNVDWVRALTDDEPPALLPPDELKQIFHQAGVTPDREIVTYCQAGVRASHTYLVLRLLGYPRVRMYDASWVEWGNDPEVPIVAGEAQE